MASEKIIFCLLASLVGNVASAVPLQIKKGGLGSGEIFVDCSFDGHAEVCKIDTGGSHQFIKYDNFSKAYTAVGQVSFKSATGAPRVCDEIEISKFEFAGISLYKQRFIRCDSAPNDFTTIGINQLQSHSFNLNLRDGSLEIDPIIPREIPTFPLKKFASGQFSIPIQAAGQPVEMLFDTGAGLSLMADSFVALYPSAFIFVQDVFGGYDGTGAPIYFKLYNTDSFLVGNNKAGMSSVLTMNLDFLKQVFPRISGVIGFNHMLNRNWYIDPVVGIGAVE